MVTSSVVFNDKLCRNACFQSSYAKLTGCCWYLGDRYTSGIDLLNKLFARKQLFKRISALMKSIQQPPTIRIVMMIDLHYIYHPRPTFIMNCAQKCIFLVLLRGFVKNCVYMVSECYFSKNQTMEYSLDTADKQLSVITA